MQARDTIIKIRMSASQDTELKKTGEPFTYLFRKMWRFSAGNRSRVACFMGISVIANLFLLAEPLVFGVLLNEIQANGITAENITTLIAIVASLILIPFGFWVFHGWSRIIERKNAFLVRKRYKEYILDGVLSLKLDWHNDRDSGDTIDKVEKGTKSLFEYSSEIFIFVEIFVRFIGTAIILVSFNVYSGIALFLIIAFAYGILHLFDRRLVTQYSQLNTMENSITAKVFDGLSNITSVVILRIKDSVLQGIRASIDAPYGLFMKNSIFNEWKWFTSAMLFEIAIVVPLVLFIYATLGSGAAVEVGTISALYLYLRSTGHVFFSFAYHYEQLLKHRASVFNAENLENHFAATEDRKVPKKVTQSIQIENLNFSYAQSETEVKHLDDISVHINSGERIALVGASGSGKTTFLKVLHGLYPVTIGSLSIDGKKIRKKLNEIDLGTTLVPQEPELFSASIEENITLGVTTSQERLERVIELAAFSSVVEGLPKGLESKINEKGVNLSGGQKQRLALARALLFAAEKRIILLDESTSSVDPVNERKIYQNICSEFSDQTIIASIHKFNLLDQFDRVILFADGKIVGDGTIKELRAGNQMFKEMWREYSESVVAL